MPARATKYLLVVIQDEGNVVHLAVLQSLLELNTLFLETLASGLDVWYGNANVSCL